MNFGKYFKLNRNLSRIEEGFALYDYMDLPAYFGNSRDNLMSPKYPVSLTITSDTVQFRLHYSSYKIGEDPALYKYDLEYDEAVEKYPNYSVKMAHMEEVILELPFINNQSTKLSDTIKEIYSTTFPQKSSSGSTGGRFLEQLIKKRYTDDIAEKDNTEASQYNALRETVDSSISYSSLWLMDLLRNFAGKQRIGLYDDNRQVIGDDNRHVIGFLRKLLLDFMFDLKHSDVFQNSANYQKMYSGLMSDFYFSALIHKCEYYYYRKITSLAIEKIKDIGNTNISIDEKEKVYKERIKAITVLYANELVKAEDLWIQDIMNPQAEKVFDHRFPGKHFFFRELFEFYSFETWPSWFAEPEEEMRRVCFTMKDRSGRRHVCNADTLVRFLDRKSYEDQEVIEKMLDIRNDDREKISKWFLKQYAFSDVFHLHLFKHANTLFILLIAFPALISLFSGEKLLKVFLWSICFYFVGVVVLLLYYKPWKAIKKLASNIKQGCNDDIIIARRNVILNRVLMSFVVVYLLIALISNREKLDIYSMLAFGIIYLGVKLCMMQGNVWQRLIQTLHILIASLHLLFPRLVAAIAMAWITLSMGFDLYVSYFDCKLNWYYIICIAIIVVVFVMYEINRITPHSSPLRKLFRSLELLIISYSISLLVGVIVINFLGEKYLERGGYMQEYYDQYVNHDGFRNITMDIDSIYRKYPNQMPKGCDMNKTSSSNDSLYLIWRSILAKVDTLNGADTNSFSRKLVDSLVYVYREKGPLVAGKDNKQYIAAKEKFWGMDVFILRNFLIMFSFIAMFSGIFIQLIIFGGNKQMTEL